MHKHNTRLRRSLLALALAGIGIGAAQAQDSGVGVNMQIGNALDPSGGLGFRGCDPDGPTWLSGDRHRTPTGFLYGCIPDTQDYSPVDGDSGWQTLGTFRFGYLHVDGDETNAHWRRYNDFDDGVIASGELSLRRPADGSYVDVQLNRVNQHNQFYKVQAGRAGQYKVQAFGRTTSNVTSGNAKSIWDGVGTHQLTLKPGLTPANSTSAQVAAVSAAAPEQVLRVVRDQFGVGVNYLFNPRWSAYLQASHEERQGARPFGGTNGFNFFPFVGTGGIYEIPRPIDDRTINLNGGVRFVGNAWRMEFGYTGSFFRNGRSSYSYEVPLAVTPMNPAYNTALPPGLVGLPTKPANVFAYEPENDHHRVSATVSRRFGDANRNEFSLNASFGRMSQDDALLPPTNCQGFYGSLSTIVPIPPMITTIDCAEWNTTAALSRQTADLSIDTQRINGRLVLQPVDSLTLQFNANYQDLDYEGDYLAQNPLNGLYGYFMANGAFSILIPGQFGVFGPPFRTDVTARVRNAPFDRNTQEFSGSADWRVSEAHTIGAKLSHARIERENRQVFRTRDNELELSWSHLSSDWLTLRGSYTYFDRSGSDYVYEPTEWAFSSHLPGYLPVDPVTMQPLPSHPIFHTDAMRVYDVASNTQHKVNLMATFVLPHNMTLYASGRLNRTDYDAEIGRQSHDTQGYSLQWEWQPNSRTMLSAWLGHDRSEIDLASVNDDDTQTYALDPTLGGGNYPIANRWWMTDSQRNSYAGATFKTRLGRATLDAAYDWMDSTGTTRFRFNSVGALQFSPFAPFDPQQFPDMRTQVQSLTLGIHLPITPRFGIRLFDTYQRGRLSDWHYAGFDVQRVYDQRVYIDGGPRDYSVNMFGVLFEVKL